VSDTVCVSIFNHLLRMFKWTVPLCGLSDPKNTTFFLFIPRSAGTRTVFITIRLQSCVIKQTTVQAKRPERRISMLNHCLQWDKFVLRTYSLTHSSLWFNIYILWSACLVEIKLQ